MNGNDVVVITRPRPGEAIGITQTPTIEGCVYRTSGLQLDREDPGTRCRVQATLHINTDHGPVHLTFPPVFVDRQSHQWVISLPTSVPTGDAVLRVDSLGPAPGYAEMSLLIKQAVTTIVITSPQAGAFSRPWHVGGTYHGPKQGRIRCVLIDAANDNFVEATTYETDAAHWLAKFGRFRGAMRGRLVAFDQFDNFSRNQPFVNVVPGSMREEEGDHGKEAKAVTKTSGR